MDEFKFGVLSLVFIILIGFLGSFFVASSGDLLQGPGDTNIPFSPILGSDQLCYDDYGNPYDCSDDSKETDWFGVVFGAFVISLSVVGIIMFGGVGAPVILPAALGILGGTSIIANSSPPISDILLGLPVIGNIFDGVNFVFSAMGSFMGVVRYSSPMLGGIPLLPFLLFIPIGFVFFMIILKIIRGN